MTHNPPVRIMLRLRDLDAEQSGIAIYRQCIKLDRKTGTGVLVWASQVATRVKGRWNQPRDEAPYCVQHGNVPNRTLILEVKQTFDKGQSIRTEYIVRRITSDHKGRVTEPQVGAFLRAERDEDGHWVNYIEIDGTEWVLYRLSNRTLRSSRHKRGRRSSTR